MITMTGSRFQTVFDEPVAAMALPGVVGSGSDEALQVVDGLHRGNEVVGRVTDADAMVGIKIALPAGTRSARVVVALAMDDASLTWWDDRVPDELGPRNAIGARLVEVLSQGEARAVTLLKRRRSDTGGQTRAVVAFELAADEIDPDGLLVIELRSPYGQLPPWAVPAIPPYSAVGVVVGSIEIVPLTSAARARTGHLAGGHLPPGPMAEADLRAGFFVANPGTEAAPPWALRPVLRPPQRRLRYRRGKPWRSRANRKAKRLVKELLPASTWPAARQALAVYRSARRDLVRRRSKLASVTSSATSSAASSVLAAPTRAVRRAGGRRSAARSRLAAIVTGVLARDGIRADAVELHTGAAVALVVHPEGRGRVRISPLDPPSGPVLVRVRAGHGWRERLSRRWLAWRLTTTSPADAVPAPPATPAAGDAHTHGSADAGMAGVLVSGPAAHRPVLGGNDGRANRAVLAALLRVPGGGTIALPAGRFPLDGGLVIGTGWTVTGAPDGTSLVQPQTREEPMLHVTGSRVRLRRLRLELPAASPGPHDGAHWTAITVGRYFYPGPAQWAGDIELDDVTVNRYGRCTANSVTVIGAVRDLRVRGLTVGGGGTGLMVHWGGVGDGVSEIAGPSYHPHGLTIEGLTVRSAFEGFCLSSVHDVTVRHARCDEVEIGFRLLAGDNADRYHQLGPDSEINRRITVDGCEIGWCGDLYAIRIAGWGRSEVDGVVRRRVFEDLRLLGCRIRPLPVITAGRADRPDRRIPVVLESPGSVDLTGVSLVDSPRPTTT